MEWTTNRGKNKYVKLDSFKQKYKYSKNFIKERG